MKRLIGPYISSRKAYVIGFWYIFYFGLADQKAFADASSAGFPGGIRDFAAYWAAARLLLVGGNPYSPSELLALQRSVGLTEAAPLIMWNPPWILSFIWPFGLLDFTSGQFLWLILNVFLVLFSSHQLLKLYGGAENKPGAAWLLAFTFIPTVYSLILGQVTPVIVFGLATFLTMERKKNWLGISLVLVVMSIKPHFLYLFWIAVALWLWSVRDWRIVGAVGLIGFTVGFIPFLFDSGIYSNYIGVYQSADYLKPLDLPVPSLRNVVKVLFKFDGFLIEHLPTVAGAGWVLIYWRRNRQGWVWTEHLPLILLVSIVTSPYSWTYDHMVLLPAIIQTYSWLRDRVSGVMIVYLAFNAAYLTARYIVPLDFWYFWMAPLFLSVYLWLGKEYRGGTVPGLTHASH
ncbi:MAG: glycosyltransferase family 87 protein [Candidatus Binatia bacterium]